MFYSCGALLKVDIQIIDETGSDVLGRSVRCERNRVSLCNLCVRYLFATCALPLCYLYDPVCLLPVCYLCVTCYLYGSYLFCHLCVTSTLPV